MTTSTAPQRNARVRIQRESDPINRLHFLGRNLTKITEYRMVTPIHRYYLEQDTLGEHFTCRLILNCNQGLVEFEPIIFVCSTNRSYNSISGLHRMSNQAGQQIKAALLRAVSTFLCNEGTVFATVVAHGRPGRWQWRVRICPFCGRQHFHGGGELSEPGLLGHRQAHCLTADLEKLGITSRPTYELVEL